ncbi:MAG: methyltransferase domain-containing protein [Bryobacterales bacterium]|nr:methyltransferase domain-containing protein [Bryobacterales bacterium]
MEKAASAEGKTLSEVIQETAERYLNHRGIDRLLYLWRYNTDGTLCPPGDTSPVPPPYLLLPPDGKFPALIEWNGRQYEHLRMGIFIARDATDWDVADLFDRLSPEWDGHTNLKFNRAVYRALAVKAVRHRGAAPVAKVLDFVSGTGLGFSVFRKLFPRANLCAFDLSPKMASRSKRKGYCMKSLSNNRLRIPDHDIDLVAGAFVLGLLRADFWIHELSRILAPGGVASFNLFNPPAGWEARFSKLFSGAGIPLCHDALSTFSGGGKEGKMHLLIARKQ